MKQAIIHIGAPKTGTTFLQKHFYFNKELLNRNKIYYPIDETVSKIAGNAKLLAMVLDGKPSSRFSRSFPQLNISELSVAEVFNSLICTWKDADDTLVLSAENFTHAHAKGLKNLFANDVKIRVVLFIRRQDHWIESYFNQFTKTGEINGSVDSFIHSIINEETSRFYNPNWLLQFNEWKRYFEDTRVVVYEDAKDDLLRSFYSTAELDLPCDLGRIDKKQVSLNSFQLAYLIENNSNTTRKEFNRLKKICMKAESADTSNEKFSFISKQCRQNILDHYRDSNKKLFDEIGIEKPEYFAIEEDNTRYIDFKEFTLSRDYIDFKNTCNDIMLAHDVIAGTE